MMLSVLSSFVIYMQNLTLDAEVQGILYIRSLLYAPVHKDVHVLIHICTFTN